MLNVFDVAYYVLDKCGKMSTFKLHKLLYYCQAWYMSWNKGTPLFQEDFEAWINGPVVRELFNIHKGLYEISKYDIIEYKKNDLEKQKKDIDKVLSCYSNKNSISLVLMSHRELPWKNVRDMLKPSDMSNKIISKEAIYSFYENKNIEKLSSVEL